MFCPNCGKQVPDQASFCPSCGCRIADPSSRPTPASSTQPAMQKVDAAAAKVAAVFAEKNYHKTIEVLAICILVMNALIYFLLVPMNIPADYMYYASSAIHASLFRGFLVTSLCPIGTLIAAIYNIKKSTGGAIALMNLPVKIIAAAGFVFEIIWIIGFDEAAKNADDFGGFLFWVRFSLIAAGALILYAFYRDYKLSHTA